MTRIENVVEEGEVNPVESSPEAKIAEIALREIHKIAPIEDGILLSRLGQRVSEELGAVKTILGPRITLRKVLENELGSQISFLGHGTGVAVTLAGRAASEATTGILHQPRRRRYDKVFWAAFSKLLNPGFRRFLKPKRPYDFRDRPEEYAAGEPEWIEVEASRIPSPHLSKAERESLVHVAVEEWCAAHGLDPDFFVEYVLPNGVVLPKDALKSAGFPPTSSPSVDASNGLQALRRLIEAVPVADRSKFSLSLDLIHSLISRS